MEDTKFRILRGRSSLCILVLSPLVLLHVALLLRSFFAVEKARYRGRERVEVGAEERWTDGRTDEAGDSAKEGGEKKEKGGGEEEEEGARAQKRKFGEDREKRDTMRIGQLDRPYIHKVAVFLVLSLNDSLFLVVVLDKTRDGQDHDLDLQDHHW